MSNLMRAQPVNGKENDQAWQETNELFTYMPWSPSQIEDGKEVTEALKTAFYTILMRVPPCPTRTRALNNLVDARMLANAAITHHGKW